MGVREDQDLSVCLLSLMVMKKSGQQCRTSLKLFRETHIEGFIGSCSTKVILCNINKIRTLLKSTQSAPGSDTGSKVRMLAKKEISVVIF